MADKLDEFIAIASSALDLRLEEAWQPAIKANLEVTLKLANLVAEFPLPVAAVPVPLDPLPIGVQIIAAPWREDVALRIAHTLEQMGTVNAPRPKQ